MASPVFKFGPHVVTNQVWHATRLTMCIVNNRPLLPGHVLVCPKRGVQHLSEMQAEEVTDMFLTVQRVSRLLKRLYKTSAVNIGISDGVLAGQTVPHVHAHVIPRQYRGDYDDDKLFADMEKNVGEGEETRKVREFDVTAPRPVRTDEDMVREATWLRTEMDRDFPGVGDAS